MVRDVIYKLLNKEGAVCWIIFIIIVLYTWWAAVRKRPQ